MKIKLFPPQAIHELGKRSNQEDCISPTIGSATTEEHLYVLCDGMGGHERGEVASGAICLGISDYFHKNISAEDVLTDDNLNSAIEYAYQQLDAKDNGEFRKAGTTMALLFFHRGGCTAAHIGDSRIYHIRPSLRSILYQSRDHSLVFELYQSGEITYDEMKTHPRKNQISRAMIPGKENRQKADIVHITDIRPGDYFFICSDGVLEHVENDDLINLLASNTEDDYKRQRLIEMTGDSDDNHSAYMIHVGEVTAEEGDATLINDEQTVKYNAVNIHPVPQPRSDDDIIVVKEDTNSIVSPVNHSKEPIKHTPLPTGKSKPSSFKWLPFLLGAVVVAAIIIVYAFIINPPHGEKNNKSKEDLQTISTEERLDSLAPIPVSSTEDSHPNNIVHSSQKPKENLNAKKVVSSKKAENGKNTSKTETNNNNKKQQRESIDNTRKDEVDNKGKERSKDNSPQYLDINNPNKSKMPVTRDSLNS